MVVCMTRSEDGEESGCVGVGVFLHTFCSGTCMNSAVFDFTSISTHCVMQLRTWSCDYPVMVM